MSSLYKEYEVFISSKQKNKLQAALKAKKTKLTIKVQRDSAGVGDKALLLLTKSQIAHIEGAARDVKKKKKDVTIIRMSKRQLRANMTFEGGFLSILAGLAARVLPTLLTGLASGLVSGLIERAVTKKKRGGDGIYIRKGKHCYRANPVKGDGLFLSRHRGGGGHGGGGGVPTSLGDGLFLRHGRNVYDGKGLILGRNSPFKNIPILGWLL